MRVSVVVLPLTRWMQFKQRLIETLEAFHADNPDLPGIGMERLRLQLDPRLAARAFAAIEYRTELYCVLEGDRRCATGVDRLTMPDVGLL